jgi:hypothetical protein
MRSPSAGSTATAGMERSSSRSGPASVTSVNPTGGGDAAARCSIAKTRPSRVRRRCRRESAQLSCHRHYGESRLRAPMHQGFAAAKLGVLTGCCERRSQTKTSPCPSSALFDRGGSSPVHDTHLVEAVFQSLLPVLRWARLRGPSEPYPVLRTWFPSHAAV